MPRSVLGLAVALLLFGSGAAAQQPPPSPSAAPEAPPPPAASGDAAAAGSAAPAAPSARQAVPPELQPHPGRRAIPRRSGAADAPAKRSKRETHKGHSKKEKEPDSHPIRPGAAVATFPGFKMLPTGGSRVFVEVSRKVDVSEHRAEGRITYRLKGATVPIRTNRLPIDTTFFASPVVRIQLVEQGNDADLVIETRQPTQAQHRIVDQGTSIVLEVDFPPSRVNPPAAAPQGRPTKSRALRD